MKNISVINYIKFVNVTILDNRITDEFQVKGNLTVNETPSQEKLAKTRELGIKFL